MSNQKHFFRNSHVISLVFFFHFYLLYSVSNQKTTMGEKRGVAFQFIFPYIDSKVCLSSTPHPLLPVNNQVNNPIYLFAPLCLLASCCYRNVTREVATFLFPQRTKKRLFLVSIYRLCLFYFNTFNIVITRQNNTFLNYVHTEKHNLFSVGSFWHFAFIFTRKFKPA